ncbi:hypothetical protein TIFTF001_006206 [Ficus carica]|uniref:Cellulose synthase n=1 Tax=Ficus carica TaxID=3494 RepID=A0AA88CZH9_FICCA|nr:hypothetical protein TIFTF001_006206 [Ficus carica]
MTKNDYLPLFETKLAKGRIPYLLFATTIFSGICLITVYRTSFLPPREETSRRYAWIGLFLAELWFGLYWFITAVVRWSPFYRYTFKDRLSPRYEEVLPSVDIFVCTADPTAEPPCMVVSTVLSLMALDYPLEKLNVYLSDDGCSDLTFYAMLEASRFAKQWLPFCRKFRVEPRSPDAYFRTTSQPLRAHSTMANEWTSVKVCMSPSTWYFHRFCPLITRINM